MAGILRLEKCSWVITLRNEELGRVVRVGVLFIIHQSAFKLVQNNQSTMKPYFSVDNRMDNSALNDTLIQLKVECIGTGRVEVQVLVSSTGLFQIHEPPIDDWEARILNLNAEALCDGVG
jgi:hypothetical protein